MNKVMLLGRLARDPETRYSQGDNPLAITRYTLAVDRRFKKDGGPTADFIGVVAFGKSGEFAEKYFKKGMMVSVVGRMQVSSYDDKDGNKRWTTDVVVEEQSFGESKASFEARNNGSSSNDNNSAPVEGFYPVDDTVNDDDLPF